MSGPSSTVAAPPAARSPSLTSSSGTRPGRVWLDSIRDEAISFLRGDNNAPWAILAETVLGCVPILGQVIDARDVIKGLAEVGDAPRSEAAWFNLVTALVGIVPGGGDAVKRSTRAVRAGTLQIDEVLDFIRRFHHGDPEQVLRRVLDPGKIVARLEDVLASPALTGNVAPELARRIALLRSEIGARAAALKGQVDDWLLKGRKTSAATGPAAKKTHGAPEAKPDTRVGEGKRTRGEHSDAATPTAPNAATLRTSRIKQLSGKALGVFGEHMADYHCQQVKGWGKPVVHDQGAVNPAKLNDAGKLVQLWPLQVRGRGIDAVWKTAGGPKPYAIIEAKASCDPTKSLAALLGDATDKNETSDANGGANARSSSRSRAGARGASRRSGASGVRQTNGKVTQMSLLWIERRLGRALKKAPDVLDEIRKDVHGSPNYTRHVLFFSIPQAAAHAEALIMHNGGCAVQHSFHAAHAVTREWGDNNIAQVVNDRANIPATQRRSR